MLVVTGTLTGATLSAAAQDSDVHPSFVPISPQRITPSPYADPHAALASLEERMPASDEAAYPFFIEATRAWTTLAVIEETTEARARALEEARRNASEAVALEPTSADARYWMAAALGLASDDAGGREKISFAREAHEHVTWALELDGSHPGANHILGRLHAGSLRLSFVTRMIARALGLGDILAEANWEDAERRMRMAAEAEPDQLVYALELGKLLLAMGKEEEGTAILDDVASRHPRHRLDLHSIDQARRVLAAQRP